jgi:hypothetical protein
MNGRIKTLRLKPASCPSSGHTGMCPRSSSWLLERWFTYKDHVGIAIGSTSDSGGKTGPQASLGWPARSRCRPSETLRTNRSQLLVARAASGPRSQHNSVSIYTADVARTEPPHEGVLNIKGIDHLRNIPDHQIRISACQRQKFSDAEIQVP